MRGAPDTMGLLRPRSVQEAVRALDKTPQAIPLAGGTDFMVAWNAGQLNDKMVLDLSALRGWKRIQNTKTGLRIGALVTHSQIQKDPWVSKKFPLLAQSCATVGAVQIQERGTLGGNIANASPAGDTFPPLAVYGALIHTISLRGKRAIPFLEMFAGVKKTILEPGELIESIEIPFLSKRPGRQMFRKVGTRAAQAISKTVAAGLLWLKDGKVEAFRFALGSMAPTVRRLTSVESFVTGKPMTPEAVQRACELVSKDVSPIDDIRSSAEYRLHVSQNLLRNFIL